MTASEKVYLAETLITVNRLIGDIYDKAIADEGLLTMDEEVHLEHTLLRLRENIECRLDNE